jgi:hypothetical protein
VSGCGFYGPLNFGNGLNIGTVAGATYPAGSLGEWNFQAPGTGPEAAHIFKADFCFTDNIPAASSTYGPDLTCQEEGIFSAGTGAPESGLRYRGPTVGSPPTAGPFATCVPDLYDYKVFCLSVCDNLGGDPTLGSPSNYASLVMLAPYGVNLTTSGWVYMASSLIFESDKYPPHIAMSQIPTGWVNSLPVTLNATDYGVGTYSVSAAAPGWSDTTGPPSGCYVATSTEGGTPGSGNTGDRNHRCPIGTPLVLNVTGTSLPEGSYNLGVSAADVVGNTATPTPVAVKIDRTPPQRPT